MTLRSHGSGQACRHQPGHRTCHRRMTAPSIGFDRPALSDAIAERSWRSAQRLSARTAKSSPRLPLAPSSDAAMPSIRRSNDGLATILSARPCRDRLGAIATLLQDGVPEHRSKSNAAPSANRSASAMSEASAAPPVLHRLSRRSSTDGTFEEALARSKPSSHAWSRAACLWKNRCLV